MPRGPFMVFLLRKPGTNPSQDIVELVDGTGHVAASADFKAPATPVILGCVPLVRPVVRVAAGAAFYADSTGAIHRLDPSGSNTQVAAFPITAQSFLSFGVSPDGQHLTAIIVSTPPLTGASPQFPVDPYVPSGQWTLDMETAIAGGATTTILHKAYGHQLPSPGPTFMAGWDDDGMTAMLNSVVCVQNAIPSVEYTGTPLIHLAADGTHLAAIGGSGCSPWDELHDGTILCGGSDWQSFGVRTSAGSPLWSRSTAGLVLEPRLSPAGDAVVLDGDHVALYLKGSSGPANLPTNDFAMGWFGSSSIVALQGGSKVGLIPITKLSSFTNLGVVASTPCTVCTVNPPVWLAGTIGI